MATPGRRITTHEATVKTAAVEVKTLTISGKQVTLAVFRQLQREDLLDARSAALRGVPWGRVNYFWGDCAPDHLHVVWQLGDELRRDCVYERAQSLHFDELKQRWGRQHLLARLLDGWRPTWLDLNRIGHTVELEVEGERLWIDIAVDGVLFGSSWEQPITIDKARVAPSVQVSSDAAMLKLRKVLCEWFEYERQWALTYQGLKAIDQLFIAV